MNVMFLHLDGFVKMCFINWYSPLTLLHAALNGHKTSYCMFQMFYVKLHLLSALHFPEPPPAVFCFQLLQNLQYAEEMTILCVHNGAHMLPPNQWDERAFIKRCLQRKAQAWVLQAFLSYLRVLLIQNRWRQNGRCCSFVMSVYVGLLFHTDYYVHEPFRGEQCHFALWPPTVQNDTSVTALMICQRSASKS